MKIDTNITKETEDWEINAFSNNEAKEAYKNCMETRGVTLDQDELGQQTREFWIKNLFIARDQEREISACIKDYDENETISTTGGNHESPQMQYKDKIWNMNDKEDLEKR